MSLANNTHDFRNPSLSTAAEFTPRLQTVQFGGGYKDVRGDGINNLADVWSVQYTNVPRATWALMDAFLRVMASDGSTFYWLRPPPFNDAPVLVRCTSAWKPVWDKPGLTCSASLTLEEV